MRCVSKTFAKFAACARSLVLASTARNLRMTSVLILALAGCTPPKTSSIVDAASTPLRDLNVVRAKIPELLREAKKHPYVAPSDQTCDALSAAVRALDEVLGPDLDAPASPSEPRLIERANDKANEAAVDAVRRSAEGVVPFRSWVRQLSGAERYSREVAAAIAAGAVRRGFLRGLSAARDCPRAE
jgi:hypothetical protein